MVGQMSELVLFLTGRDVQVDVWEVEGVGHPFINEGGLERVGGEFNGGSEELEDPFGRVDQSHEEPFVFFFFVRKFSALFQVDSEQKLN